jgi:hypothetical protein
MGGELFRTPADKTGRYPGEGRGIIMKDNIVDSILMLRK